MHYYISLLLVLGLVNIGLPLAASEDSAFNAEDQGIDSINIYHNTSYLDTANSLITSEHLEGLDSTTGYYLVQTQPPPAIPEDREGNLGQSNSTDEQGSTEDKTTSDSASNEPPSTGSTEGNLTPKPATVRCEGSALCITGEVVKVINGKTFYINIQNKVYKVELALIGLPLQSEEAMRAATTFTRNTCLGSNVLIDQDDGQKVNSFIAQVYCSPTKHLNSMLLQTGYVQLDKSQCQSSEFSKLDWAKSYGC
ncbi:MAG TPA: thermonuclease family protein [Nitrososphaeraceae archaeon]|nr:thermonuclease family protein [Nitrososphaeraceae archaeon]